MVGLDLFAIATKAKPKKQRHQDLRIPGGMRRREDKQGLYVRTCGIQLRDHDENRRFMSRAATERRQAVSRDAQRIEHNHNHRHFRQLKFCHIVLPPFRNPIEKRRTWPKSPVSTFLPPSPPHLGMKPTKLNGQSSYQTVSGAGRSQQVTLSNKGTPIGTRVVVIIALVSLARKPASLFTNADFPTPSAPVTAICTPNDIVGEISRTFGKIPGMHGAFPVLLLTRPQPDPHFGRRRHGSCKIRQANGWSRFCSTTERGNKPVRTAFR